MDRVYIRIGGDGRELVRGVVCVGRQQPETNRQASAAAIAQLIKSSLLDRIKNEGFKQKQFEYSCT